jgi:hypothetical protein
LLKSLSQVPHPSTTAVPPQSPAQSNSKQLPSSILAETTFETADDVEDEWSQVEEEIAFNGLEFVNKKAVEIDFGNFQSSENGELETAVTIGALEGDGNLGREEISIFDPQTKIFVTLDNEVRASSNFFNSTITINDKRFTKRVPSSLNTLGFDLAKIKIPNVLRLLGTLFVNRLSFIVIVLLKKLLEALTSLSSVTNILVCGSKILISSRPKLPSPSSAPIVTAVSSSPFSED